MSVEQHAICQEYKFRRKTAGSQQRLDSARMHQTPAVARWAIQNVQAIAGGGISLSAVITDSYLCIMLGHVPRPRIWRIFVLALGTLQRPPARAYRDAVHGATVMAKTCLHTRRAGRTTKVLASITTLRNTAATSYSGFLVRSAPGARRQYASCRRARVLSAAIQGCFYQQVAK